MNFKLPVFQRTRAQLRFALIKLNGGGWREDGVGFVATTKLHRTIGTTTTVAKIRGNWSGKSVHSGETRWLKNINNAYCACNTGVKRRLSDLPLRMDFYR